MSFWNRLFGNHDSEVPQPDIKFGRYSDAYKTEAQHEAWDRALTQFETQDYLGAYLAFLEYLKDPEEGNVYWQLDGDQLCFELYQGSKKINGYADANKVKIEAKIVKTQSLSTAVLRRLMEQNFSLQYSRFALDPNNNLTIVFDTYTLDGSPYKLYYALKELATNADKQDDLLMDEFANLEPVEVAHLKSVPEAEKEVKYAWLEKEIRETLEEIERGKLDKNQYPGGISYLLLNLVYKLDYLIKPEGFTMETLERVHRLYFAKDERTVAQKNLLFFKELQKLATRPKAAFFKEMYRVPATFGITTSVGHEQVVQVLSSELPKMDWYQENGYDKVALAIPTYIVGKCLFNFAIPKYDRLLFHLYFRITEAGYFKALGFQENFRENNGAAFQKKAIKRAIEQITEPYRNVTPDPDLLVFDSPATFARSYLVMMMEMKIR
ncbi:MAG: hypothetical protein SH848_06925 [Saprospiraceae bacterium]|nr:hypothetical protein [Saprospiraceae bacterium]MDZ4703643.1 hypothetical protein [Saprospiraceae bacterium]